MTPLQVIVLLLVIAISYEQSCQIPPNCDSYSVSQQKCTACLQNFILIGGTCISAQNIVNLISSQQTSTLTQGLTDTSNSFQASSRQVDQQSTSSPVIFVPWYSAQAPLQQPANNQNLFGYVQYTSTSASSTASTSASGYSDNNCQKKDSFNTTCEQCYNFFYLNTTLNQCTPVNPLCRLYTNQNQCTACYDGYNLNNGNCTINPSYGAPSQTASTTTTSSSASTTSSTTSQGISVAQDSNCKNESNGVCYECYSSFYYNFTLGKCTATNPNCKTVTNNNRCTSCYNGYQLNSQTYDCDMITSAFSSSSAVSSSTVFSQQTSSSSSSNINQNGNGQFFILNGFVYQINSQHQFIGPLAAAGLADPNCNNYSNGQCVSCNYRYYLVGTSCAAVDSNCASWTASGVCLQCQSGYTVVNGNCNQANYNSNSNQNAAQLSSNLTCYPRQVPINGVCVQVNDQCKKWSNTTAACTDCYGGYSLNNGACV